MIPERLKAILQESQATAPPTFLAGRLSVETRFVDEEAALAALDLGEGTTGWLCWTGAVARYAGGERDRAGPLLAAETHHPESDTTVCVRLRGARYALTTYRPSEGPGIRSRRSYRAADGGPRLVYETAWGPALEDEGPTPWRPLATRFAGTERRED